jgi:hypothetical protein
MIVVITSDLIDSEAIFLYGAGGCRVGLGKLDMCISGNVAL